MCQTMIDAVESQIGKAIDVYQSKTTDPVPGPTPIPEDATCEQRLCALTAYLLYLLDLIACLDETDPTQCVADAASAYQARYASCFPE